MISPFWHQVQQAYEVVATNHERRVTVEHNGNWAEVYYDPETQYIAVFVKEVPAPTPKLIVPS